MLRTIKMDAQLNQWFYGVKEKQKKPTKPKQSTTPKRAKSPDRVKTQQKSKSPERAQRTNTPKPLPRANSPKPLPRANSPPKAKQSKPFKKETIRNTTFTNVNYVVNNYHPQSDSSSHSESDSQKHSDSHSSSTDSDSSSSDHQGKQPPEKKGGFFHTIKNVHKAIKDTRCEKAINELLKDPSKNTRTKTTNANDACISTSNKDEHCDEFLEAENLLEGTPGASGWFKDKTSMHAYMQDLTMTKYCRRKKKNISM